MQQKHNLPWPKSGKKKRNLAPQQPVAKWCCCQVAVTMSNFKAKPLDRAPPPFAISLDILSSQPPNGKHAKQSHSLQYLISTLTLPDNTPHLFFVHILGFSVGKVYWSFFTEDKDSMPMSVVLLSPYMSCWVICVQITAAWIVATLPHRC